jgi:putative sigma-54 modulation protein
MKTRGGKMDIKMSFKDSLTSDAIKAHVEDKSKKLEKFFDGKFDLSWVFFLEGGWHIASVVVSGKNFVYRAEGKTTNLYASIDFASRKLERQIGKKKAKVKNKRSEKGVPMPSSEFRKAG